jgi:tripartite-type tricarboxylate transporter receptor subunit TctC
MIVPFLPGGGIDLAARIVGQKLGDILGQQIAIENRGGASGTIGAEAAARAAPDGYTIVFTDSDLVTIPSLLPRMNFDPDKDLLPITMVTSNPLIIVASASAPFSNVKELLDAAKTSPTALAYGTPGTATINRVVGEWIAVAAHIKLLNIPYMGGSELANAIAADEVPLGIVSPAAVYPGLVDAGKIKVIAQTGTQRASFLPSSWPTLAESALPINATLWLGLFAPAGTPDAIVSRLDQAMGQILQDDFVRKRMNNFGIGPEHIAKAAFAERIRADRTRYEEIIRQTGVRIEQ